MLMQHRWRTGTSHGGAGRGPGVSRATSYTQLWNWRRTWYYADFPVNHEFCHIENSGIE